MKNVTITLREEGRRMAAYRGGQGGLKHVRFCERSFGDPHGARKRPDRRPRIFPKRSRFPWTCRRFGQAGRAFFIDTNILIYALDPAVPEKRATSTDLLSPQNLNECYKFLTLRRLVPRDAARTYLMHLMPWCIAPLDARTTAKAWAVQDEAGLEWCDALLVASALMAGCKLFISEDMQDGTLISGMRIVNPFTPEFSARHFAQ